MCDKNSRRYKRLNIVAFPGLQIRLGGTFGVPYQLNRKWIEKSQGHVKRFRWPHCRIKENLWQKSTPGPRVGAPTWYLCKKSKILPGQKKSNSLSPQEKIFFSQIETFDPGIVSGHILAPQKNFFPRPGMQFPGVRAPNNRKNRPCTGNPYRLPLCVYPTAGVTQVGVYSKCICGRVSPCRKPVRVYPTVGVTQEGVSRPRDPPAYAAYPA